MKTFTICTLFIPMLLTVCLPDPESGLDGGAVSAHVMTTGSELSWSVPDDSDESSATVARVDGGIIVTIISDGWWGEETIQIIVDGDGHGRHEIAEGIAIGAMTSSGIYRCLSWEFSGQDDAAIGHVYTDGDGDDLRLWYEVDFVGHDPDGRLCSLSVRDGYFEQL